MLYDMTPFLLSQEELEALQADMRAAAAFADQWLADRQSASKDHQECLSAASGSTIRIDPRHP